MQCCVLCIVIILLCCADCIRIDRKLIRDTNIVSLFPKVLPPVSNSRGLSELLYFPCPFSAITAKQSVSLLDDDHFCSMLCDKGYTVHCVDSTYLSGTQTESTLHLIAGIMEHIFKEGQSIILIGNELATLHLLRLLLYMDRSNSNLVNRVDRLVLVDPPPLHSLRSEVGRRHILQRYFPSVTDISRSKEHDVVDNILSVPGDLNVDKDVLIQEVALLQRDSMHRDRAIQPASRRKRHKASAYSTVSPPKDLHNGPGVGCAGAETHRLSILSALETGRISTSDLLGTGALATATDIDRLLGAGSVSVVYSGALDDQQQILYTPHCMDVLSTIQSPHRQPEHRNSESNAIGEDLFTNEIGGNDLYSGEQLAPADQWGAEAVQEVAAIYKALPVHSFQAAAVCTEEHSNGGEAAIVDIDIDRHNFLAHIIDNILLQ